MVTGERWRPGGDLHAFGAKIGPVALWLGGLSLAAMTVTYYAVGHRLVGDGHAYWLTGRAWYTPYLLPPDTKDAYLYSPAFAQLMSPLTRLDWPAFATVWVGAEAAAFAWLLRPLGWRWALPLLLWCSPELVIGNVLGFLAIALVLAVTRPAAWSAMLLTKPTLAVGALWHVSRGEWRRFGVATLTGSVIVALSCAIDPGMWMSWIRFLIQHSGESIWFFPGRIAAAVTLAVVAGRSGRAWLLAPALLLATPVLAGSPSLTILAAIPRLRLVGRSPSDGGEERPHPLGEQRGRLGVVGVE